jgi:phosphate transport system permease protein
MSTDFLNRGRPTLARIREAGMGWLLFLCAISATAAVCFILLFLAGDAVAILREAGPLAFLAGPVWDPTGSPPAFGTLPLVVGTLLVTAGAMLIAIPLSVGCAVFVAELASPRVRAVVKPTIELLAGIPSVVYGFFGLVVLSDWLRVAFDLESGLTWLAGSLLLGIMALPTITSVSEDAIAAVPREFREGSLALGATRWQTIRQVVVPAALSGITAAVILGMGRAIGETMAVLMVTGNAAVIPSPFWNVFSPVRTLTGTLGIEMGEVPTGSPHYHALFGVAVLLLVITLLVNSVAALVLGGIRASYRPDGRTHPGRFRASLEKIRPLATGAGALAAFAACNAITGIIPALAIAAALAAVLLLMRRITPRTGQAVAFAFVYGCTAIVIAILAIILWNILSGGIPALSWDFLTRSPRDLGRAGGIFPAIVGTLYLVLGAIGIALPLGIGAAIYLVEYTRGGRLVRVIRTGVDLLNGTPSIVFGLFGFAFLVLFLGLGISLIAGQVTLALMVLPTVIRTTEEAIKSVPQSIREGSLALGATRWQTVRRVVLPPAMPGVLTGAILSIGRAAGETAPIMFTAVVFSQRFLPGSLLDPVMALPYHLFILATNVPGARENQYGTALVLLLVVIGFYSLAIAIRTHYRKTVRW